MKKNSLENLIDNVNKNSDAECHDWIDETVNEKVVSKKLVIQENEEEAAKEPQVTIIYDLTNDVSKTRFVTKRTMEEQIQRWLNINENSLFYELKHDFEGIIKACQKTMNIKAN